jgi:transposase
MKTKPDQDPKRPKSRRSKKRGHQRGRTPEELPVVRSDTAGVDLAVTADIWVAVPPSREGETVRSFSPMSHGLEELVAFLLASRVNAVAMEATGVYWSTLYSKLMEAGIDVTLVQPRDVRRLNRPKSDIADCQWLQYLHSVGLLKKSFVPPPQILAVRAIARQRERLVEEAARHVQHAQQALDEMNLHLHHVLSDLVGTSGQAIIEAILAGERNPEKLAALCHHRVLTDRAIIAQSLTGQWREEHLFVLQQAYESWQQTQKQMAACDKQLWELAQALEVRIDEKTLAELRPVRGAGRPRKEAAGTAAAVPPPPRRKGHSRNGLNRADDWPARFHALFGVDLLAVPGVNLALMLTLLVEIGTDWSAFASAGHFSSWLGLCPHNDRSGRKVLRRRTAHGQSRLKAMFRMAAQSLWQSHSPLGTQYRKLKGRLGPASANTAMAHRLARVLWHMMHHQKAYDESIFAQIDQKQAERTMNRLRKQAKALGFELTALQMTA